MKPLPGQQTMFGEGQSALPQYDAPAVPLNPTVESWDTQRLNDQHHAILAALQGGPKTNRQLGMICQRFGARLHELKRAGHPWTKTTLKAGVVEYRLLDRGES